MRGPKGEMMDARRVAGWVTLPDGQRTVCPRCEGQAFIRAKGVSSLMPRAQDIATGDHFISRWRMQDVQTAEVAAH